MIESLTQDLASQMDSYKTNLANKTIVENLVSKLANQYLL